jgi:hypothetical protein
MIDRRLTALVFASVLCGACGTDSSDRDMTTGTMSATITNGTRPASFGEDVAFLRAHTPVVVLQSPDGEARIAVAPAYQGRVMTSTAAGEAGTSHGYLHRPVIAIGEPQPHMTVVGGEDRFWLGPEGGQYALYFPPGAPFDTNSWQVPLSLDWDTWPILEEDARHVRFTRSMSLTNYAGTLLELRVDRTVRLYDRAEIAETLGVGLAEPVVAVGFESDNTVTNIGQAAWQRETGAPSIWILGMFPPGPRTTVMIPFVEGPESELGPIVNDAYVGKIPPERPRIEDGVIYFRGDGSERGKIGVPRPRAREIAGSYDPDRGVLTLVTFSLPAGATDYVNSMWEVQDQPYGGDVVNSYNDGPVGPGELPLGPFYEIQSSSPAALLAPGASLRHVHRTLHFEGPAAELDALARATLGVGVR